MVEPRVAVETVSFVDNYCAAYEHLFATARSYEAFKFLHLGMISEIPRKTLPAIAKVVGLPNDQVVHHFLTESPWEVDTFRHQRLSLILQQLQGRSIVLVIDDTGDRKKGKTTDYVARQYIGNLGKVDNGIVSVNAYGVLGGITFPLLFKVFKPQGRLKEQDGDIPSFNWLKKSFKSYKHLDLSLSWSWQIVSMASVTRLSGY
jgi:SRSO17 transposase